MHDGGNIKGEGIHLSIPRGAIHTDDSPMISLRACIAGPFFLPEGFQFVSPVYLIQPHYVFNKNVTLSLEVFSKLDSEEDCSHLIFVTSSSRHDTVEKGKRWTFQLHEGKLSCDVEKKTVTTEFKHFCQVAAAGNLFILVA